MITSAPSSVRISPAAGWLAAQQLGFSAALWRLPRQQAKQLIIGFEQTPTTTKIVLEDLPSGFAVSPFLNPDGTQSLFIEADLYFRFGADNAPLAEQINTPADHPDRQAWEKQLREITQSSKLNSSKSDTWIFADQPDASAIYQKAVAEAVETIANNELQKVVLSRTKTAQLPADFDVLLAFDKLCVAYPNAFVSLVYLPHLGQIWLGATPETLVSMDKNGIFKTVSLAGTQSAHGAAGELLTARQAQWTHKEIEEQALVSRYIIGCFKKIRVREYEEEGPKTVIAGNLMHLRTDYSVDTHAIGFPEMGSVMLELLHPTSAVCGTPKTAALAFIKTHEGYNRELYSGFLGPVNVEQETHLFVNLRCLKIENQTATLYAGGGVTEESVPEKEWQETELKCQTLLSVI